MPGEDSFTSALIFALEELVDEQPEGRFTTVELLNKIQEAPNFPDDQTPVLSDRKDFTRAGRIMLHPLQKEGSSAPLRSEETTSLDPTRRHTFTLHFDVNDKPSLAHIKKLGLELNTIFERNNLGVNRIRWGGLLQSTFARVARKLIDMVELNRLKRQRTPGSSDGRLSPKAPGLLTPSLTAQHSPRIPFTATGNVVIGTPSRGLEKMPRSPDPSGESEDDIQSRRKRRKLSVNVHPPNAIESSEE